VIECVPNFSEGRDGAKVEAIADAIQTAPGALVLGWELDPDHNRSVVTFVGERDAVLEGALRGVGKAVELIDLGTHRGIHPRVGAADVIPFVPLDRSTFGNTKMADCIDVAHRAGAAIWERYRVPVYFYEAAALSPRRRHLQNVRRREFDGAPPDVGDIAEHPTAGASVVGAREFLIAYNINLATQDAAVAQEIARKVRQSSGGFPFVKALGLYLPSRGCAQVSMNLTNFNAIPFEELYQTISREAEILKTSVASSELIGFVPRRAFEAAPAFFTRAENFDSSRILETRIEMLAGSPQSGADLNAG
jgi:glutamate formiminotransferase